MRRVKAAGSCVVVRQSVTTAIYYWIRGGYTRRVITMHHPVPDKVYFRGGRKKCINHFRSRAGATGSTQ